MSTAPDTLPTGFMALPQQGGRTLDAVVRKLRLLALRRLLAQETTGLGAPLSQALARLQQTLMRGARRAPEPLLEAVGQVDVLAPLLALESGAAAPAQALTAAIPNLLCAPSVRGAARDLFEDAVLWDVPVQRLVDVETGRVHDFDPPALGLSADPTGVELRLADGSLRSVLGDPEAPPGCRTETRLHPIGAAPTLLATVDTNPLWSLEQHPDKHGNAIDLGGRDVDAWRTSLAEALGLIAHALPVLGDELTGLVQRVVPVGFEPEKHLSASYREAPGLIYMTLHPSALTLAEAFIHEAQHGKLNALSWLDPVLTNGHDEWAASPVRPDLRPLMGVLLAAHAFVPVAALHAKLRALGHPLAQGEAFIRRRREVLDTNASALATLAERADPTATGRRVLDALGTLQAHCEALASA